MTQIRVSDLETHLARTLSPVYTLHGDEPLLAIEAADAIRAAARGRGHVERVVLLAERGFKWSEFHAAGAAMSLFGDRRTVELRIPGGKPGEDGGRAIEAWCARVPPDTVLIVSLPRLAKRDQSSGWFQALAHAGVLVDIYPVERTRLSEWIAQRLARQKQQADRRTLEFLVDSVEGNLLAAHQEIQKLALLVPPGELDFDVVSAAVLNVARYDPTRLAEAVFAGDPARLSRMLDGLRAEGEAPPRIVWILAEELRALARVQAGLGTGRALAELCREHRIWGAPRQEMLGRAARRFERSAILAALAHAARIDRVAKGVGDGEVWDELLALGLRFAMPGRTGHRQAA